jgi:hypothetical protein
MKKLIALLLPAAALVFVISCASTPPTVPPQVATPEATAPAKAPAPAVQPAGAEVPDPEAELTEAKNLQKRIDDFALSTYDPDTYAGGVKDLQAGEKTYGQDNASSKASLTNAISAFKAVIAKGTPLLLSDAKEKTDESKKAADDLKASVAVKDGYSQALTVYQAAVQEKNAGDLENASRDFASAREQFDVVATAAQEKKDAAMLSLQDAQKDGTASEQMAADAVKTLQDEGITLTTSGQ